MTSEPIARRRLPGLLSLGHVIMLLAGLLAFLLVLAALRERTSTDFVATAANDIAVGVAITGDDVELIEVAGGALPGAVLTSDRVNAVIASGQVTERALDAGTLLQVSDFVVQGVASSVRSMSIPIAQANAVAGNLRRGDLVDIIATNDEASWHIAASAEVLEVATTDSGFSGGAYTVTVAVDPVISLRIANAIHSAEIDIIRATGATPIEIVEAPRGEPGQ